MLAPRPTGRTDRDSRKKTKKSLKISLIDAEASASQISAEHKTPRTNESPSPMAATYTSLTKEPTDDTEPITTPTLDGFKCTLGASRYIECIAPNQKGNFIISLCIDELNGWILAGQCSGTLNAWKIPQNTSQKDTQSMKNKVYECRNLLPCEEDGIRHIYCFDNNISCMVGYRRLCSFINYDQSTEMKKKLGINDVFTYSPFTSPHMFYSTQHESTVHIFCRSFSCALKIDLKTQRKEVLRLKDPNKISLKSSVLTVNKNFIIWQTLKTKYNFYVKTENLDRNKRKKQTAHNVPNDTNNTLLKWYNQWQHNNQTKQKYTQPTLKKIEVRSLQNFNLIHEQDYFEPVLFNAWGFQLDNVSMNIAFVTDANVIQVMQVTPDLNIMQYGLDYDKKQQPPPAKKTETHRNKTHTTKRNDKSNNNEILVEALTLQAGLSASYDASMDTQSMNDSHMIAIDVLQNDGGDRTPIEGMGDIAMPQENENMNKKAKQLYTFTRHKGHILAIQYMDGIVLSMATDRKLCVWNGKNGTHIATMSNIPGTFTPGYPYIIKKSHSSPNQVFYTADDGIFMAVF